jgi:hypothetical protein
VKLLGEWRPGSKDGSLPVDDVDGDDEDEGDAKEDGVAVLQISWRFVVRANIYECQLGTFCTWGFDLLEKNGVAGIVKTPARKSLDHPLPPVADAE